MRPVLAGLREKVAFKPTRGRITPRQLGADHTNIVGAHDIDNFVLHRLATPAHLGKAG